MVQSRHVLGPPHGSEPTFSCRSLQPNITLPITLSQGVTEPTAWEKGFYTLAHVGTGQ